VTLVTDWWSTKDLPVVFGVATATATAKEKIISVSVCWLALADEICVTASSKDLPVVFGVATATATAKEKKRGARARASAKAG